MSRESVETMAIWGFVLAVLAGLQAFTSHPIGVSAITACSVLLVSVLVNAICNAIHVRGSKENPNERS